MPNSISNLALSKMADSALSISALKHDPQFVTKFKNYFWKLATKNKTGDEMMVEIDTTWDASQISNLGDLSFNIGETYVFPSNMGVHFETRVYILKHGCTFWKMHVHFETWVYILKYGCTFWNMLVHFETWVYILKHGCIFWNMCVHWDVHLHKEIFCFLNWGT